MTQQWIWINVIHPSVGYNNAFFHSSIHPSIHSFIPFWIPDTQSVCISEVCMYILSLNGREGQHILLTVYNGSSSPRLQCEDLDLLWINLVITRHESETEMEVGYWGHWRRQKRAYIWNFILYIRSNYWGWGGTRPPQCLWWLQSIMHNNT